jgi:hypothetical protein
MATSSLPGAQALRGRVPRSQTESEKYLLSAIVDPVLNERKFLVKKDLEKV